ncbi:hypothetical protein B0H13DRAFT_2341835 [Mycena leptocephala]|nr:hypothetical protein B0H13DRAFT_2341835 [Mycena leptocephala]
MPAAHFVLSCAFAAFTPAIVTRFCPPPVSSAFAAFAFRLLPSFACHTTSVSVSFRNVDSSSPRLAVYQQHSTSVLHTASTRSPPNCAVPPPQDSASSRAFWEPSSLVIVLLPRPSLSPLVSSYPLQAPPFTHQLSCALSEYRCCHLKSSAALASFFRRLSVTHDMLYPKASVGSSGPVILFPARPPYVTQPNSLQPEPTHRLSGPPLYL